ncbi:MAG: endonuclease/exonuclease/phosphatase family protein, partial [Candidatus Sericytochromatia bacterium]
MGQSIVGRQPVQTPAAKVSRSVARPAAAQTAPKGNAPAIARDMFSANPAAVNVVCFNAAGGASGFKLEGELAKTPLLQKLINGSPDAPIVAVQETTPALAKKLLEEAEKGHFEVIWPGKAWLPKWVPISPLAQGNMLLVPKRYEIEKQEAKTFTGRAGQFFKAIKGIVLGDGKANDLVLALQNRGYVSAALKDTRTGKRFNVLATHISYQDEIRRRSTRELVEAIAKAKGPTVLMGDMNVPTPEPGVKLGKGAADFWKALEPAGMTDMGPLGEAGASYWKNGANIDVVMARGFKSESSRMLKGDQMTLPGRPDARQISDHYAEADSLVFE